MTAAAAAAAGLLAGWIAIASPQTGLLLATAGAVALAAARLTPGMLAAALVAYLPFEGTVASHLPASTLIWVRYAPEAIVAVLCVVVLARNGGRLRTLSGGFGALTLLLLAVWAASAIANAVPLGTALLGVRAELRYLPLAFLLAAVAAARRDARLLATAIAASAMVQGLLAYAELLGGAAVHHLLAQSYTVHVGGVTVTHDTAERFVAVTGSMRTYNELAAYLAAGWLVLALAGRGLALPRYAVTAGLVALPPAVLATGSREGALFLALSMGVAAHVRLRVPVFRIVALAAVIAAVSVPWWAPAESAGGGSGLTARLASRWSQVLQPATWSGTYGSRNFRLYLARDELGSVVSHSAGFGWGTGTIDDPRTLANGRNPLLYTTAGRLAIASGFAFDGSWSLLLTQSGLAGLAAMLLLVGWVALAGRRIGDRHWLGTVLPALSAGVLLLGLFAPVLQQHSFSAAYWGLAGCGMALLRELDGEVPLW